MCIGIFASRDIQAGEELTFDYHFERYGDEALKCLCGEPNCRGYIGAAGDFDDSDESEQLEYDPDLEPAPYMIEAKHVEQRVEIYNPRRRKSDVKRASKNVVADADTPFKKGGRRFNECERILGECTNAAGSVKNEECAISVLRIIHSHQKRMDIANIMNVVLKTSTRSLKVFFVDSGVLRALCVLLSEKKYKSDKLWFPVLRLALTVMSHLPLSKEVICSTKTAASSMKDLLFDFLDHEDSDVCAKAKKEVEKYMPEKLEEHLTSFKFKPRYHKKWDKGDRGHDDRRTWNNGGHFDKNVEKNGNSYHKNDMDNVSKRKRDWNYGSHQDGDGYAHSHWNKEGDRTAGYEEDRGRYGSYHNVREHRAEDDRRNWNEYPQENASRWRNGNQYENKHAGQPFPPKEHNGHAGSRDFFIEEDIPRLPPHLIRKRQLQGSIAKDSIQAHSTQKSAVEFKEIRDDYAWTQPSEVQV